MTLEHVQSADGTAIAYERAGCGPPVLLIGGAFCDRTARASGTPLAALLAHRFTVWSYDRRGRGDSGDTPPYRVDREVEDVGALLAAMGAPACVFGNSSGGLLALDAAIQGLPISKLVLFEPPVALQAEEHEALARQLDEAVRAGRRGEAVERFFTQVMRMPAQAVAPIRASPMWSGLEALAHTLSYDLRLTARGPARLEQVPALHVPTLLVDGDASPAAIREPLQVLARAIPGARHLTLKGQSHAVEPPTLARVLEEFFTG